MRVRMWTNCTNRQYHSLLTDYCGPASYGKADVLWHKMSASEFSLIRSQGPNIVAQRKPILVVDDDTSMRTSMKRLLREHGFTALLFETSSALLNFGDFDAAACIIIDINLGDQSGI